MADGATNTTETFKINADRFTAAGNQAFREGVERSLAGLNEVNAHSKKNLEAVVESVTAATRGAEALGAQALSWSKKSWDESVNAAQALTTAKSVQEVVELQTQFARSAMETYMAELNRWTETVSATVKDTMKPVNERMTVAVERFQSTR
jgi:phasin family protein